MENVVLNYKVLVSKDRETGGGKSGYTALVPKLGIADSGYSIEEALKNIRALIKFHLESLAEEGAVIPLPDSEETLVTSTRVELRLPKAIRIAP